MRLGNAERIHRSNLVGMGILPLTFIGCVTRQTLGLKGDEIISITGLKAGIKPRMEVSLLINGKHAAKLLCRIDTLDELEYYKNGGILPYTIKNLLKGS